MTLLIGLDGVSTRMIDTRPFAAASAAALRTAAGSTPSENAAVAIPKPESVRETSVSVPP